MSRISIAAWDGWNEEDWELEFSEAYGSGEAGEEEDPFLTALLAALNEEEEFLAEVHDAHAHRWNYSLIEKDDNAPEPPRRPSRSRRRAA